MSKPKLILCDLGNVLVDFDHRIAVRRIRPYTDKAFKEIYQIFFDSSFTKDYEEGRISSSEFYRRLKKELGIKNLPFQKFTGIWNRIFQPNAKMVALLKKLKKNHRLHLVSNINELHYEYIEKTYPRAMEVFDKVILSYKVGARKPHPRIYRAAIEDAGFLRREALYTDDRVDLIQEAGRMGIPSLIFRNAGDLERRLRSLGVLR